jgi:protein KRI1
VLAVEEKFGSGSLKRGRYDDDDDSDDESSSSEDEDDVGVLATEDLDKEIFATLAAIKNKDPRVYDGKTSFYTPIDESASADAAAPKKEKPMYLRDYHRENLLAGNVGEEEEESKPQTYAQQQANLKDTVVKEMHNAAEADENDDDDDDEGFLVRKPSDKTEKNKEKEESDIPDPALADKDPEEFLNKFLASRAWAKSSGKAYVPIESDDSEDDVIADEFEFNYNMRFEDPDAAARAKLVSYGRDAVNANTVRREEKSRRKKAREEKLRRKEEEKAQREIEKGRLKKLKTEEIMKKFKMVKEAADLSEEDEEAEAAMLQKLLEGDFSDGEWDNWMKDRFSDKYYDKGRLKKPEFDDDIDINDIVPDFEDAVDEDEEDEDEGGVELEAEAEDEEMKDAEDAEGVAEEKPAKKKKKDIIKEKQVKKAKERSTRRKVERFVEDNFDFDSEVCFVYLELYIFHVLIDVRLSSLAPRLLAFATVKPRQRPTGLQHWISWLQTMPTSTLMPGSRNTLLSETRRRRRRTRSGMPKRSCSSNGGRKSLEIQMECKCLLTGSQRAWYRRKPRSRWPERSISQRVTERGRRRGGERTRTRRKRRFRNEVACSFYCGWFKSLPFLYSS